MSVKTWYRGMPIVLQKLAVNDHSPFSGIVVDARLSPEDKHLAYRLLTATGDADVVSLGKIDANSDLADAVLRKKNRQGIQQRVRTPVINIEGSWERYLAGRSRKFRKSLKNKLNRYTKYDDFSIRRERITTREHPALAEMIEVSANSWKRNVGADLLAHTASKAFLFNLVDSLGPAGGVTLWMLRKAGVPIAYEFHLEYDRIIYPLRADYDEGFKQFSPGSVLECTVIKSLFDTRSADQYFTCAGNFWYLSNWTSETVEHVDVELFAPSLKGYLLYAIEYQCVPFSRRVLPEGFRTRVRNRRRPLHRPLGDETGHLTWGRREPLHRSAHPDSASTKPQVLPGNSDSM